MEPCCWSRFPPMACVGVDRYQFSDVTWCVCLCLCLSVCVWYIAQIRNTELTTSRENPEQRCACVFDVHSLTYVRFCSVRFSTLPHFIVLVKPAKCDVSPCSMLLISFLPFCNSSDIIVIIIIIVIYCN